MKKLGLMLNRVRFESGKTCEVCGKAKSIIQVLDDERLELQLVCDCAPKSTSLQDRVREVKKNKAFRQRIAKGSFSEDDGMCKDAMKAAYGYASNFREIQKAETNGLLLYGPARQGKTFIAEAIANKLLHGNYQPFMVTASEWVSTMQSGSKQQIEHMLSVFDYCDLLIIDDVGSERDTSFGRESIFSAVDRAYSARKPMVITTNMTMEQMTNGEDIHSQRLYGRILERCLPVEVDCGRVPKKDQYSEIISLLSGN